jgi:glycosyltransferase involved in cell wall biosynthesis
MKVLLINKFLYAKGGDAISTLQTGRLLTARGHDVVYWGMAHAMNPDYPYQEFFIEYTDLNQPGNIKQRIAIASNILFSFDARAKISDLVSNIKPDIVHLNNFAHQISPSILQVFQRHNIPTVMTLHDYKMVCASYLMVNNGKICEACKNGKYNMCFWRKCVKGSRLKSLLNTMEMYLHHKILHLYDLIDVYIAPSIFLRQKLYDMGFSKKIVYLPNFVNGADTKPSMKTRNNRFLYFGRLAREKGLETLIRAATGMDIDLHIVGAGPYEQTLKRFVKTECINNVHFMGYKSSTGLAEEISEALAVVVPSEWYENNPRTVLESFAVGTPVLGARIGGIPELVINNETGLTFQPGDIADLRKKILYCVNNKEQVQDMGKKAQHYVRRNFNATKHYSILIDIYNSIKQ